jgi:hypothetical protein
MAIPDPLVNKKTAASEPADQGSFDHEIYGDAHGLATQSEEDLGARGAGK